MKLQPASSQSAGAGWDEGEAPTAGGRKATLERVQAMRLRLVQVPIPGRAGRCHSRAGRSNAAAAPPPPPGETDVDVRPTGEPRPRLRRRRMDRFARGLPRPATRKSRGAGLGLGLRLGEKSLEACG